MQRMVMEDQPCKSYIINISIHYFMNIQRHCQSIIRLVSAVFNESDHDSKAAHELLVALLISILTFGKRKALSGNRAAKRT
jgi:hypothetical protein